MSLCVGLDVVVIKDDHAEDADHIVANGHSHRESHGHRYGSQYHRHSLYVCLSLVVLCEFSVFYFESNQIVLVLKSHH